MELDELRTQICACLALRLPQLADPTRLVDECLANAQKSFRNDFILGFRPEAWAQITIIYFKHFLDTGCDVSIGEIFHELVRDAIHTSRMDMLTLQLAQRKLEQAAHRPKTPSLTVVRPQDAANEDGHPDR